MYKSPLAAAIRSMRDLGACRDKVDYWPQHRHRIKILHKTFHKTLAKKTGQEQEQEQEGALVNGFVSFAFLKGEDGSVGPRGLQGERGAKVL